MSKLLILLGIAFILTGIIPTQNLHTAHTDSTNNISFRSFYSNNWAGYIIAPYVYSPYNQVRFINGTFNVPVVMHSPTSTIEETAVWIGIDGYNKNFSNTNLIQTGILGENNNGNLSYFAWYELIPAYAIPINMTVRPNDTIYAQITLLNNATYLWNIFLMDVSTGKNFSKNVYYYTPMQTAEWIVEAPTEFSNSSTGAIATLAPFSKVQFTNAYLTVVGKTHNDTTAIGRKYYPKNSILINYTGTPQTYTSPISTDGLSFSVYYKGQPASTNISSTTSTSVTTTQSTTPTSPTTSITTTTKALITTVAPTSVATTSAPIPNTIISQTTSVQSNSQISGFVEAGVLAILTIGGIVIIYYMYKKSTTKRKVGKINKR